MQDSTRLPQMLSRDTAAVLLVDHQIGLLTGVRDMNVAELKHNVVALAKSARVLGVPVVVTATAPDGMWGPTMPELTAALPDVQVIGRTVVNAWDEPEVVAAVEATGRRQLLIAGLSLEVCATFPALSATAAGYEARVVLDASGTFYEAKRTAGLQRLGQAGVMVTDYATAVVEMLKDKPIRRPKRCMPRWTCPLPAWWASCMPSSSSRGDAPEQSSPDDWRRP